MRMAHARSAGVITVVLNGGRLVEQSRGFGQPRKVPGVHDLVRLVVDSLDEAQ
jgi:hypothetical protein